MCFLTVIQSSQAGVSDAQRRIIDNQLFLLKEGMVSEKEVFKKAKNLMIRVFLELVQMK